MLMERTRIGNWVKQIDGGFISWNEHNINCDNEPELAIGVVDGKNTKLAIVYGAVPNDLDEHYESVDQSLAFLRSKVIAGDYRPGFWNQYDFKEGKWYNLERVEL
jgi:hypothetical protein